MWMEYHSDSIESEDLQCSYGFHDILFNSTTSWQIRNWFKFRGKSQHVMTVRGGVLNMSHTRVKQNENSAATWICLSVFGPVGCAEECICKHKHMPALNQWKHSKHGLFYTYKCNSFSICGHCLSGSCCVSSVYVGGAAISGRAGRLGPLEGWHASPNMDAKIILTVVINITVWFMVLILISVVFLFSIGYQGNEAELPQWLAKNPEAKWKKEENLMSYRHKILCCI